LEKVWPERELEGVRRRWAAERACQDGGLVMSSIRGERGGRRAPRKPRSAVGSFVRRPSWKPEGNSCGISL
jgi:hypothetical protein